jgi:glycosyltransferase involved in cell wall biosynthesis
MKISILAPHLRISGGTRIILTYAAQLSKRGHDVTVYVRSKNAFRRRVANVFHLGYPKWIGELHNLRVLRVPVFTDKYLEHADVLVATTYQSALAIKNVTSAKGRQFYLLQHDEGLYHGPRDLVDQAYNLPQRKIVIAKWLQQVIQEKTGQASELLINPVDLKLFHKRGHMNSDGTVRILMLAHQYPWKGTDEGVEIVSELKKRYPQVRLIMYGSRSEKGEEYACDEYHYNLFKEDLAELYSSCDIFLCTSWDEGFGLPSLEAMACGVAVATYDTGGSREFAFHEKTALVAPRRDKQALSACVERLILDEGLRERIADAGNSYVRQMKGWEEQTAQLETLLDQQ